MLTHEVRPRHEVHPSYESRIARLSKYPLEKIFTHLLERNSEKTKLLNGKVVYYAGSGKNVMTPIYLFDSEIVICTDLVNRHEFSETIFSQRFPEKNLSTMELYTILHEISESIEFFYNLGLISEMMVKPIFSVKISNRLSRLSVKFFFMGKVRKIIVYVGKNAKTFIPPEFLKRKSPDNRLKPDSRLKPDIVLTSKGVSFLQILQSKIKARYYITRDLSIDHDQRREYVTLYNFRNLGKISLDIFTKNTQVQPYDNIKLWYIKETIFHEKYRVYMIKV